MNRRTLVNVVLLLVALLLALVAVYETGKAPPPETPVLTRLTPERIEQLRIERRGAPTVLLERTPSGWQLREPVAAPANPVRAERIARVAEARTFARFPASADLDRFGLADPDVRLVLDGETTIAFGGPTPLDQRRYVWVGEEIAVINEAHYYHLIGDAGGYADERLLPAGARVQSLELPGLQVQRDGQGHWRVEPPPETASADAVTELVNNWQLARAYEVRLVPGEADGEPITIHLTDHEAPVRFLLSKSEGDPLLIQPDRGLAYRLTVYTADGLLQLPSPPPAEPMPGS